MYWFLEYLLDKYVLPKLQGIDSFIHSKIFTDSLLCAWYSYGCWWHVSKQNRQRFLSAYVEPLLSVEKGAGKPNKRNMVILGTSAMGKYRAKVEDREVQDQDQEDLRRWELSSSRGSDQRAEKESGPCQRSSRFKTHGGPEAEEHVTWGQRMRDQVRKGRGGGSPGSSVGGVWLLFQMRWEGLRKFGAEKMT